MNKCLPSVSAGFAKMIKDWHALSGTTFRHRLSMVGIFFPLKSYATDDDFADLLRTARMTLPWVHHVRKIRNC